MGQIGGFVNFIMEPWNWDGNENESVYNGTVWPISNGTADASSIPSRRQLPTNSAVPIWSQGYEAPSRAIQSSLLLIDESGNHSSTICQDNVPWGSWDAWRDVRSNGCDGLNSTSEVPFTQDGSTEGISPFHSNTSTSTSYISQIDSREGTSAYSGQAFLTGETDKSPILRGAPSDQWIRGTAGGLTPSSVASSYAESSNASGLVNNREIKSSPRVKS